MSVIRCHEIEYSSKKLFGVAKMIIDSIAICRKTFTNSNVIVLFGENYSSVMRNKFDINYMQIINPLTTERNVTGSIIYVIYFLTNFGVLNPNMKSNKL